MTSYTVKLFTCTGRVPCLQISADDVLLAAQSSVPYFIQLGEHVDGATAIVVERGNSAFAAFRPSDVLASMRYEDHHSTEHGDSASGNPDTHSG
jgi:hypothetical protein